MGRRFQHIRTGMDGGRLGKGNREEMLREPEPWWPDGK